MKALEPGTYADLKAGRRLAAAQYLKCAVCGVLSVHTIALHNERVARSGERSYPDFRRKP